MKKHILFLALISCNFISTVAVSNLQTTVELGWATAPSGPFGTFTLNQAEGIAIDLEGNAILAGIHAPVSALTNFRFAALQLIPTGFNGVVLGWATALSGPFGPFETDQANDVTVDSSGNIFVVGTHVPAATGPSRFAALQLIPNMSGGVDLGWATALIAPFGPSNGDEAHGVAIDGGGSVILAGFHAPTGGGPSKFAALQLIPNMSGGVDLGWATAPFEPFGPSNDDQANGLAIAADETIILAGFHDPILGPDRFAALQLIPNMSGGVDLGWATAPINPFGPSDVDVARGVAIDGNGNVILGGAHNPSVGANRFAALQLIPDMSGGVSLGWVTAPIAPFGLSSFDEANGIAIDGQERIILAGVHVPPLENRFAALQLVPNEFGGIDLGWATAPFDPFGPSDFAGARASSVAIDANGDPVLAGFYNPLGGGFRTNFSALQLLQIVPPPLSNLLFLPFVPLAAA